MTSLRLGELNLLWEWRRGSDMWGQELFGMDKGEVQSEQAKMIDRKKI
jgi:hypothetical protein